MIDPCLSGGIFLEFSFFCNFRWLEKFPAGKWGRGQKNFKNFS